MEKVTVADEANNPPARPRRRSHDLEDQADRFEDDLAADLIRTGVIEQW